MRRMNGPADPCASRSAMFRHTLAPMKVRRSLPESEVTLEVRLWGEGVIKLDISGRFN